MVASYNFDHNRYVSTFLLSIILLIVCGTGWAETKFQALDCVITPSIVVDVSSPVSGVLDDVTVDRSDVVKKDDIIANLNANVEKAAVSLARAKAQLDSEIKIAEANQLFDEEKYNRLNMLHEASIASPQDKDEALRNLTMSKEKVKHAKELRKLRQLELQTAQAQLNQKTIRSPINGVVVQRFHSVSEHIEDQPILRIAQLDPLHVEAIVPMELFGDITSGMTADIYSDMFPQHPHQATVSIVDKMGDAASGTFGVRLDLANPDHTIPAGIKCNVVIRSDNSPESAAVKTSNASDSSALNKLAKNIRR